VKTRDHDDGFILDVKEQTVGKFPQKCTVYVLEHDRKLVWVLLHTEDDGSNFLQEARS